MSGRKDGLVAFGSGLLFAVGLALSGMTQPAKILNFLDITGDWDPSLAFVMLGAIAVHALAYRRVPHMPAPIWAPRFGVPTRADINPRLLGGAALFGAGWAIGGFCPGPAIVSLASGMADAFLFVGAMLGGMMLFRIGDAAWTRAATTRASSAGWRGLGARGQRRG